METKDRNIGHQQTINASTKIAKVLAFLRSLTCIERPPAEQKISLLCATLLRLRYAVMKIRTYIEVKITQERAKAKIKANQQKVAIIENMVNIKV